MENENMDFIYTYSAKEQDEIKRIRQKYQPPEEDGMNRLRKLDAQVTQKATKMSLASGIVGALLMGCGMSLVMTDLGAMLNITSVTGTVLGIVIGLIGIVLMVLAYPAYNKTLKKERQKIAPEILKLTEELMK